MEILHSSGGLVEFLSPEATGEHFASLGLTDCGRLASMEELVHREWRENSHALRHWASGTWLERVMGSGGKGRRLRRDTEDTNEGGGEGRDDVDSYAFDHYVSL